MGDILDLAINHKMVQKTGTWYSYGDEKMGQGRENAKNFIVDHPELLSELETKLRKELGLPPAGETAERA